MSNVTIRVDGLDEILDAFADQPRIIEEELDDVVDAALGGMLQELATYPPPPAGSRYKRTGRLRQGWLGAQRVLVAGQGGIQSAKATNPVAYAPFVQGEGTQAAIHQGRWSTDAQVQQRQEGAVQRRLNSAIERAVRRIK